MKKNLRLEKYSNERGWFECTGEIFLNVKNIKTIGDSFKITFWSEYETEEAYTLIKYYGPPHSVGKSKLYRTFIMIKPFEGCQLNATSKELSFYETLPIKK